MFARVLSRIVVCVRRSPFREWRGSIGGWVRPACCLRRLHDLPFRQVRRDDGHSGAASSEQHKRERGSVAGLHVFSVTLKRSGRVPTPDPGFYRYRQPSALKGPRPFRMTQGPEAEQKSRVRILNCARKPLSLTVRKVSQSPCLRGTGSRTAIRTRLHRCGWLAGRSRSEAL